MLDIIKSYFSKNNYYIIILNDKIIIKNYKSILNISDNEINIKLENIIYKIKGNNLVLKKIISNELEINGIIESVKKYDSNKSN